MKALNAWLPLEDAYTKAWSFLLLEYPGLEVLKDDVSFACNKACEGKMVAVGRISGVGYLVFAYLFPSVASVVDDKSTLAS